MSGVGGRRTRWIRLLRAEARYLAWATRALVWPLGGMVCVLVAGAWVHHLHGGPPGVEPTWVQSFFVSYCLLFFEHLDPVPDHPLAQLVHYGQPLVGFALWSGGLLRLGLKLLDKEANALVWMEIMSETTRGQVIVCGLGSVGFRAAEELVSMGIEVFAVERDADGPFVERARELGVHVLVGDARADNVLRSLHVERCRAVIVATDDDLANLEVAMDVREIRRDVPIVLRLFDQRLATKVKATLGFQLSVSTSRLAAPLFASAALDPSVVGTHRIGDVVLVVIQVKLGRGSALRGHTVEELVAMGINVVAARAPDEPWALPPSGARVLSEEDELQLMIPSGRLDEVHAMVGR